MAMAFHHVLGSDPEAVKGQSVDRRLMRRALGFARPYRAMIIGFVVVIVVQALNGLVAPLLTERMIDDAIGTSDRGLVNLLLALMLLSAFAGAFLAMIERWLSSQVGEGLIFGLRSALFDHVQRMPLGFFTHSQTGALVSRLNNDVIGAQRSVTGTLGQVVSNLVIVVSTAITMLALDWRLTLLALVLLPIFVVPAKRVGRRLQVLSREAMEENAAMNTTMTERFSVAGALLVKLFGHHERELAEFERRAGRVRDLGVRSALLGRTFGIALALVGQVGVAVVVAVGAHFVISGSVKIGTVVALSLLLNRLYLPLTGLTTARVDVMTSLVSFERVFDVLDRPQVIVDAPDAVELTDPAGRLELRDVHFTYPPAEGAITSGGPAATLGRGSEVLHGLDLVAEEGTMVALVGPSGAGKSTVVSLVPRLYDVDSGAVVVDGHDVRELTQQSLRAAIGFVPQDPHLFHDTVAANLRYARPGAAQEELEAACRSARIHDVIAALPDGYDTVVGERGYRLSGGEKQRLAIARLLLKDPAIVVLDEATSHLDAENEVLVQRALEVALRGRTSLVIAHRLSTVRAADQIVVLDGGRVVERGTHDELVAAGGLYADLYQTLVSEPTPA